MSSAHNGVSYRTAVSLAVVQLSFVTCWTVYVVYLPQLAASAGIPRDKVIWILMLDQAIFAVMDLVMGQAADRVQRRMGRIGFMLAAVTLVSCLAFAAIPHVAGAGALLSLVVLLVWTVTSSALRSPPWLLLSRYAAQPRLPMLAALNLSGLAIAGAAAPYLAMELRQIDPRIPFLVASVVLAMTTAALVLVERTAAGSEGAVPRREARPHPLDRSTGLFAVGCGLLALATQVHLFVNSGPQYLRFVQPDRLEACLPLFWLGFNLAMFPGAALAERFGPVRVLAIAAVAGGLGTALAAVASALEVLIAAQVVAGGAWGCVLMAAFTVALRLGHSGREGTLLGLLWAVLSVATLLRMGIVATDLQRFLGATAAGGWAPAALWLGGGATFFLLFAGRGWQQKARTAV
jgi:MFS family permease